MAGAAAVTITERAAPIVANANRQGVGFEAAVVAFEVVPASADRDRSSGELVLSAEAVAEHVVITSAASVNRGPAQVALDAEVVVDEVTGLGVHAVAVRVRVVVFVVVGALFRWTAATATFD